MSGQLVGVAKRLTKGVLRRVAPRLALQLSGPAHLEPEMRLLPVLVDPARLAVDVGANVGTYSKVLAPLARQVIAFEPHPTLAAMLRASLPGNVEVREVALSDRGGDVTLTIPVRDGNTIEGLGTIGSAATLGDAGANVRTVRVASGRLDDAGLADCGFIKIDVEGHEEAALAGAMATIRRDRPILLIEVEERHSAGAVGRVAALLGAEGYKAFFLLGRAIRPIESFDLAYQNAEGLKARASGGAVPYVNNFIFVPAETATDMFLGRLSAAA